MLCFVSCLLAAFRFSFFFFNDTATTEIYTLSLHDALPILRPLRKAFPQPISPASLVFATTWIRIRSEEHTSELQSLTNLVCRLLLEKKNEDMRQHSRNRM